MSDPKAIEQSQDVAGGSASATGSATYRTIHMCVDIEGVMRWPDKDLARMFSDDGIRRSGKYVRDWLKLQLAQGKRVLPMGKPCEGFSYTDGCPGHPDKSPNEKADRPERRTT